jgi:hypothetical protein
VAYYAFRPFDGVFHELLAMPPRLWPGTTASDGQSKLKTGVIWNHRKNGAPSVTFVPVFISFVRAVLANILVLMFITACGIL